ncbi:hypothetical protein KGY79_13380 [Candidatus Bipolaricaulota bacterium]|nr:hypothetical protein [Candidatus Bipolaricaulota bacterium]
MKKALVVAIGLVLALGVVSLADSGVGIFAFDDCGSAQTMIMATPDANNYAGATLNYAYGLVEEGPVPGSEGSDYLGGSMTAEGEDVKIVSSIINTKAYTQYLWLGGEVSGSSSFSGNGSVLNTQLNISSLSGSTYQDLWALTNF